MFVVVILPALPVYFITDINLKANKFYFFFPSSYLSKTMRKKRRKKNPEQQFLVININLSTFIKFGEYKITPLFKVKKKKLTSTHGFFFPSLCVCKQQTTNISKRCKFSGAGDSAVFFINIVYKFRYSHSQCNIE